MICLYIYISASSYSSIIKSCCTITTLSIKPWNPSFFAKSKIACNLFCPKLSPLAILNTLTVGLFAIISFAASSIICESETFPATNGTSFNTYPSSLNESPEIGNFADEISFSRSADNSAISESIFSASAFLSSACLFFER